MSEAKTTGSEPGRSCPQAESIAAYAQGEPSIEEVARFEEHLAGCESCRREAEEFREVVAMMRELPPEPLTRDLAPDILAKIGELEGALAHLHALARRQPDVVARLGLYAG